MKINENGIIRDMTPEEIAEMKEMAKNALEEPVSDTERLIRIEDGLSKVLKFLGVEN